MGQGATTSRTLLILLVLIVKKIFLFYLIILTSLFLFSEEIEDAFDFDDLFSNAEDIEAIYENSTSIIAEDETIAKVESSALFSEKLSFSGSFSSDIAVYAQYPKEPYYIGGGIKFSNTLSMIAKASSSLSLHASFLTNEKLIYNPKESFELKLFYFDYLMFNSLLLTAGKKSYNWGNTLYFESNIINDFSNDFSLQLLFPLYPFTFSFLGLYKDIVQEPLDPKKIDLAFGIESTVFQTNIKIFGRYWSLASTGTTKQIAFGLEWKRDILGLDFYQHALYYFHLPSLSEWNPNSFQLISGLAQIWDARYKTALVIEHKWQTNLIDNKMNHAIAFNAGISRLLSGKLKLGLQAEHEIPRNKGKLNLAAILPGSSYGFPHADLQFGIPFEYDLEQNFKTKLGINLSLRFDY